MKKVGEERQTVPMLDLKIQLQNIEDEILEVLTEILTSSQYILGPKVSEFEGKVAGYIGVPEAIGVASCTDAVHLYGHMADMESIMNLARRHGLKVIEDCAQSFGAELNGKKAGSFGDAGCFSFYPSKNLGGYGDGGMIVLYAPQIAGTIRKLRNHGSKESYIHEKVGFNSRLDEIQAGILLVKLKHIDEYNRERRRKAALYTELLSDKVTCPIEKKDIYHVYHQYTIRIPRRDKRQRRRGETEFSLEFF